MVGVRSCRSPVRRGMEVAVSRSATLIKLPMAVAAAVLALLPLTPLSAQSIEGRVMRAGWQEPVPGARVQLLSADFSAVTSTATDAEGWYRFLDVPAGEYYLQAVEGDAFSSIAGPVQVAADEALSDVDLTMRSELFERATRCLGSGGRGGPAAVAGIAYDAGSDTPIPGANVRAEWLGPGGEAEVRWVEADASGRYVLCPLPSAVALTIWVEALGRVSERERGVRVQASSVARLDIPVYLAGAPSLRVLDARAGAVPTETAATLEGRLLDAETDGPIPAAEVRLGEGGLRTVTDAAGRFRFTGVEAGEVAFQVHRLGYDWQSERIEVAPGARMVVELRATPRAVALDAVVVRATSAEARMARGATQAPRVISGLRLREAEDRTALLGDVVREFPSLQIREGRFETTDGVEYGLCVESARAMHRYAVLEQQTSLPWCEMIAVVVDGAPVIRGAEMLFTLPLWQLESIEFLPPLGAIRWGERAAINGALVIWTRGRGPHRGERR
jgi:hypothetical protein